MEELSSDFRENVIKYIRFDNLISEKNLEIKELREKKKYFESYILDFLTKSNESIVCVDDDKIRKIDIESKTKLPIKEKFIEEALYEVLEKHNIELENDNFINDVLNNIENKRKHVRTVLKRFKGKKI